MEAQNPQIEDLQALQESLELQRRQALATVLELQDSGGEPQETEKARLKLVVINQDLSQVGGKIVELRRKPMSFETPEKVQAITQVFREIVSPALEEVVRARDEAEVKVQVLTARMTQFQNQKTELEDKVAALKETISQVLGEGGDPGDINRQLRAVIQEIGDLEDWIEQLKNSGIPEAEKSLSEEQNEVWKALLKATGVVKNTFNEELNDYLGQASELSSSWRAAIQNLFKGYRTGKQPTQNTLTLIVDSKRTGFPEICQ